MADLKKLGKGVTGALTKAKEMAQAKKAASNATDEQLAVENAMKAADRANAGRMAADVTKATAPMKMSEALGNMNLEGKGKLKITQADRTRVGGGNIGGPMFSGLQQIDPNYKDAAWGVGEKSTASKMINQSDDSTLWSTVLGSADQLKTNPLVFNKLRKGFTDSMKEGNLSPELEAKINHNLALTFGKGAEIRDPKIWQKADTFEKRGALADAMLGQGIPPSKGGVALGGEKSGKGVIFRPTDILKRETEPSLLHTEHGGDVPTFAVGPRLFSLSGETMVRPDLHPGFPVILKGEDKGVVFNPVAGLEAMPDFVKRHKEVKGREPSGYFDWTMGLKGEGLPTQPISEEYLTYLQKLGKKKGGTVNREESPEDMARFQKRFAMHKAIGGRVKKMASGGRASIFDKPVHMVDGGKIGRGVMGAVNKASRMADEKIAADAMKKAAESAGMKAPVTANKPLTNLQDFHTSLSDRIRQGAVETQNMIESMPFKYDKGQRVFTDDSAKKNRAPYEILERTRYGNQVMRDDHPTLGPNMGQTIRDFETGKAKRTPYEPGYRVRGEIGEMILPESAIKGNVEKARGGVVGQESPADMARFHKRFAMHKAIGGHVKKMANGGRASIFDAPAKRFDGGGIASPEESSGSPPDREQTKVGLMAEYLAKAAKDQGKEELSSLKKPRAVTDLLNRGVLANNPVSAVIDMVNMGLVPLDVLGSKLTGRDIKVSSDKPFLGSEHLKDLMNEYNITSGEERPMMETALSFASPVGMIKGAQKTADLAKKAPEALNTVRGGLETMSADAQRPFRSATLTMEGVAPDLGQKGGDKFKDLVTKRMITGEGAPVSMERMGGRKTEQTMGQGLYENFAKQLETNPMVGITIPRAGDLSTNKRLIADIGTAGRELGQEMVAAHKFTPLLFKNPKDATAMMIGGSEPLTKDQILRLSKSLPGMIVSHSPKNNSMFIAPFEGDALDYKKAAQAASEILGKGAKVQFGKADSTKDIMFRGDYDKMEARPPSAESTEMRNRLKKAEERIVRGPSVSQSQRQSPPSTLTSTVR